jgi:hypothetical protein
MSKLPPGLSLAKKTGTIFGKPTAEGNWNPIIKVTDANGFKAIRTIPMTIGQYVGPYITDDLVLDIPVNRTANFTHTLTAADGVSPYTFEIEATPYSFVLFPERLYWAHIGYKYKTKLMVNGGIPPYTWNITNLPNWLYVNTNIYNDSVWLYSQNTVASSNANAYINVSVTDATGETLSQIYEILVLPAPNPYDFFLYYQGPIQEINVLALSSLYTQSLRVSFDSSIETVTNGDIVFQYEGSIPNGTGSSINPSPKVTEVIYTITTPGMYSFMFYVYSNQEVRISSDSGYDTEVVSQPISKSNYFIFHGIPGDQLVKTINYYYNTVVPEADKCPQVAIELYHYISANTLPSSGDINYPDLVATNRIMSNSKTHYLYVTPIEYYQCTLRSITVPTTDDKPELLSLKSVANIGTSGIVIYNNIPGVNPITGTIRGEVRALSIPVSVGVYRVYFYEDRQDIFKFTKDGVISLHYKDYGRDTDPAGYTAVRYMYVTARYLDTQITQGQIYHDVHHPISYDATPFIIKKIRDS